MRPTDPGASRPGLSRAQELLLAAAGGLAVANVYFAQPLLDDLARQFHVRPASAGFAPTAAQLGYAAGLLLVVPLGDRLDRRRLIVGMSALSAAALASVASSPTTTALIASSAAVGALAVVAQVIVAHVAIAAAPERQGRAVGLVTSGIIVGILAARAVSGAMADLFGWRSVYVAAAAAALAMAVLLRRNLPKGGPGSGEKSYPVLVASTLGLLRTDRVLRRRAALAFWIFASASAMSTAMVLPLTVGPFWLTHAEVGLFGLAGAAGALGAARAGAWCDRGRGRLVTGAGLGLMLLAWGFAAALGSASPGTGLWWLAAAVVVVDFGLQSAHVANQSAIYRSSSDSRSRTTAAYMVFYSLGSALGSIAATSLYAEAGWPGVCALGAGLSLAACCAWALGERADQRARSRPGSCRTPLPHCRA